VVVHGNPPLGIPATGFETPGSFMFPTIVLQFTVASWSAADTAVVKKKTGSRSNGAYAFLIRVPSFIYWNAADRDRSVMAFTWG
jgi:hypothetical protein